MTNRKPQQEDQQQQDQQQQDQQQQDQQQQDQQQQDQQQQDQQREEERRAERLWRRRGDKMYDDLPIVGELKDCRQLSKDEWQGVWAKLTARSSPCGAGGYPNANVCWFIQGLFTGVLFAYCPHPGIDIWEIDNA
jgi:hypothetical protein